jgi:hypothetical protein
MIQPEIFDIPGFILFAVLLVCGILIIKREKVFAIIAIVISAFGLLADGYILINKFILGN